MCVWASALRSALCPMRSTPARPRDGWQAPLAAVAAPRGVQGHPISSQPSEGEEEDHVASPAKARRRRQLLNTTAASIPPSGINADALRSRLKNLGVNLS